MLKKIFFLLVIIFFLAGCSVDPVTGRSSYNFISEKEEIALGDREHVNIAAQYGVYNDPKLSAYVQSIVSKIGDVSHRPQLNYRVTVLDTPQINAFALPGGNVYVCRGILPYMNSEAELAAVMAHEIGHVTARHTAERLSSMQTLQYGVLLGSLFFKDDSAASLFYVVGSGASLLATFSFSRENEMEADRLSIEYADKAGFSPLGTEKIMQMFMRMSGNRNSDPLFSLLTTHPVSDIRAKQARIEVRKLQEKKTINTELNRDRYLQMIDGILIGHDPETGIILDNIYYNAGNNFKFEIPSGFAGDLEPGGGMLAALQNSKEIITIYFNVTTSDIKTAQKAFVKTNSTLVKETTVALPWQNKEVTGDFYFIKNKDKVWQQVAYLFVPLAAKNSEMIIVENDSEKDQQIDLATAKKMLPLLKPLNTEEAKKLPKENLKIYQTKTNDTWQSVAEKFFKKDDAEKLAWLNGCELSEPLPKQIKLKLF